MVVKEKIKKTYGPHVGLNMAFADEPDFICIDKATQTSFEDKSGNVSQEKAAHSYTANLFLPGKGRYYTLKTRVQERACTIQTKSELRDYVVEKKQKKEDLDQHLECDKGITLQPAKEELNEEFQKVDAVATVTGQILLAVASLRDTDRNCIQAAAVMLNAILKKERNKLREKVPEIIEIIYFHLQAIQEPNAREAAIGAVCLLAENHTEEVLTSLLRLSLFCDRHVTQIWEALGQAKQPVRLQVLAKLLDVLKRKPCLKNELSESDNDDCSLLPLAATKALCIIFKDRKCKVPMNSFYVSVIIFLVIQLHYLVNYAAIEYGQEEVFKISSYIRALVKHHRGLDYAVFTKVIPFLHHGDDQQKLTAMAFFTALLSSESTYAVLQKHYILGLLKNWQMDSSTTYRWLSLYGMGNLAHHLQNKKEVTGLILDILPSFNDPDEKVILTAIEAVSKIIAQHKSNANVYIKITKQLQPFLADGRTNVCCAANRLFQDIIKNLDVKDKIPIQDQVLTCIVTLMVNLQDPNLGVAKSRRDSLTECKAFLGWTTNENQDSLDTICKNLVKEHPGKLRTFLHQAQDCCQSPLKSSQSAARLFIDSILEHMESNCMQKSEVDLLRHTFSSSPPEELHSVPVVVEPKKACRFFPDLFRCSRYFPRSCI